MADTLLKRTELLLRRGLIATVVRLARRPRRNAPPELSAHPRILLLRPDRLGDAIVSTAVMKLLRERFPAAVIDVLLGHRNGAIAPILPAIDESLELLRGIGGLRRIRPQLKARHYDVVVNLHSKDSASGAILAVFANARYRIGFQGALSDIYDFAVPRPARPMHIVPHTALLLAPFGIPTVGDRPRRESEMLELHPLDPRTHSAAGDIGTRDPRIVVSISARDEDHTWPDENVVALIERLRPKGYRWSVAGTADHRARVEEIARAAGVDAIAATASFPEFVDSLRSFDIVVTPQTSTVHVGSALRLGTILLNTSGESDSQWTPWGVPCRVLARGKKLSLIPVDEVAGAVVSLVEELRASAA